MRIYRATTPTCFEMQNNELIKFIGSLICPTNHALRAIADLARPNIYSKKGTE